MSWVIQLRRHSDMPAANVRIGIAGWRYPPWRGVFYPKRWPQSRELEYASRQLSSIELNGSFYALQTPERYASWYAETPEGFVFSVKAPRYITHIRRLREVEAPIANFLASGLLGLREKLGPILWQLPPSLQYNPQQIEEFLTSLPHNTEAAAVMARHKSDSHLHGHASFEVDRKRALLHALEVRHESFRNEDFIAALRRHQVALVIADTAGKWPYMEDITAGFVYLRLHGDAELYVSGYPDAALQRWATRIRRWREGLQPARGKRVSPLAPPRKASRDVYCYFDNDTKVKAPFDAMKLAELLGTGPKSAVLADRKE